MAFQKPGWLATLLGYLNWDIFTWKVYIGDTIEAAIDVVFSWLNYAVDLAQAVWNWIAGVVDWVVNLWNILWAEINTQVQALWNAISTWSDSLNTWWSATWSYIVDWVGARFDSLEVWVGATRDWIMASVDAIADQIQDRISIVTGALNNLIASWNVFVTSTLPGLASHLDVTAAFDSFMLAWKDLFDWWGEFWEEVTSFFTDPFAWIYERIDEFFERYW
ncbi:hypothetical protein LCGC14_0758340 [marine sediment metagenome]|uniref:Uncharacterized protein n=1 Tax=marine sediment metagenome TaxID=412755 RepID=A0A0F9QLS3_9ZZZZ